MSVMMDEMGIDTDINIDRVLHLDKKWEKTIRRCLLSEAILKVSNPAKFTLTLIERKQNRKAL
jgi:hypothetical protein